ncbi:MAG: hypothetical protein IPK28_07990 [Devosia sp.]|nr:hypothetical protein [Devosia sp.]
MTDADILDWLVTGDPSVAFQARRDLEGVVDPALQRRIATEGWGAALLAAASPDATWGRGYYVPKWISTHYTLLDLRLIGLQGDNPLARRAVDKVLADNHCPGGGVIDDVCVNGMALNFAAWFRASEAQLRRLVDYILARQIVDGGFNCDIHRGPVQHSSMHSTIGVLEGFAEYEAAGHRYRLDEIRAAADAAREFLLAHQLFRSHRTGEIIKDDFLRFPFPPRWKYNVLRALDHFRAVGAPRDSRMDEALEIVRSRQSPDGRWKSVALMSGELHLRMERAGKPGRWQTLIALRTLRHFG